MRRKLVLTVVASLWIACGGDDGGGGGRNDAGQGADGGGDIDADPGVDAAPLPACAEDLNPLPDNSTALVTDPNIVISEIDPGTFIEIYNSGASDVMLNTTGYRWCNNQNYSTPFSSHNILVNAGGRRRIAWPGGNGTEAGGDVAIFSNSAFTDGTRILSYVCWGDPSEGGANRLGQATPVNKWVGACAPAIPAGGSLARLPNTTGTSAADFETLATPEPEDCE